eukprot:CAMPEP_0113956760 /NCGR_PEP_ID=MMETSP0011_2-20120614/2270_1 /TAXON_ID=101924 /ORGANISM="Rhodosorus marinus" /LENGTH=725 /DNA_ID=CAMNT_0000967001 /DNA_START=127 /DNA_END=2304 /DNA_ORIENTATION=- /assembly_acc=CAM_ASM_000156
MSIVSIELGHKTSRDAEAVLLDDGHADGVCKEQLQAERMENRASREFEQKKSVFELESLLAVLKDADASNEEKGMALSAMNQMIMDEEDLEAMFEFHVIGQVCQTLRGIHVFQKEVDKPGDVVGNELTKEELSLSCSGIRCIALLVKKSSQARIHLMEEKGLELVALAALEKSMVDVRVDAYSTLATIGIWSGPRYALKVVETPGVMKCMDYIIRDEKNEFDNTLKVSMVDAVSVLASRNRARKVLLDYEIEHSMRDAARSASNSRAFNLAAKASVASGALDGKTLNDLGFLVEVSDSDSVTSSDVQLAQEEDANVTRTPSKPALEGPEVYNNVLKTHADMLNMDGNKGVSGRLFELGDYLTVARATAAATRGGSFSDTDAAATAEWRSLITGDSITVRRKNGEGPNLKALARQGIPHSLRCEVWPYLLSCSDHRGSDVYEKAVNSGVSKKIQVAIDKDITRTMPEHELFWAGGAQVGLKSLRAVLRAYAAYHPEVGYCQGMSSLCALFMVNAETEEDAFHMFSAFMDQFRFKGVYSDGLPVMYELVEKIISLGTEKTPAVMEKIAAEGVPLDSFLPVWVMTGFTYYFPPTLAFKIWDIVLVEGNTDMFVCSALAVLALSEAVIMSGNMEQITLWFQNGFAERKTGIVDDPELFLKTALDFESATKREEDDEEPSCSMFSKRHPLRGVRRLPGRTFEFVQRTGRRPFSKLTERRRKKAEPCCSVH